MQIMEMLRKRRSIRKYTDEAIPQEKLDAIVKAGLLSASSRNFCPWELIVVRDKAMLEKLADSRNGAKILKNADTAVVVIGDESKSDVWVEDCSIVMANMHLAADSMGIGSCWIHGRLRERVSGESTESYVRALLGFPKHMRLEAILSLGIPAEHPAMKKDEDLHFEKVHCEKF